jgi:hypothetical protein
MSDARSWLEEKLRENGYQSTRLPASQLIIERTRRPAAQVLCVGLARGAWFEADDLDTHVKAVPDSIFVVVVPTRIAHSAYERAEEIGVCVTGFGELLDALRNDDDIASHVDSQEKFERSRLTFNRAVESIKRKGHHAYTIRRRHHRSLTIVTTNTYEFTADELYSLLESYAGIDPDFIVVTNPNCHGLSTDSRRAAEQTGVPVILFGELLDGLSTRWT